MKFLILSLLFSFNAFSKFGVGSKAPEFSLMNQEGKTVSLKDFKGKTVVLEWYNKDCPFVKKQYSKVEKLVDGKIYGMPNLQKEYTKKGVVWLSIVSSAKGKQGYLETPAEAKKLVNGQTHILLDKEGTVGKSYKAKVTPHIFIINKEGNIAYDGAVDSIPSTQAEDLPKAKNFIHENLQRLIAGKDVFIKNSTPYGCSVKF